MRRDLDAYLTSEDVADTCAIQIELVEGVAATPKTWTDGAVTLDHVGLATAGAATEVSHDCGTEAWVEEAVAMLSGYDWWVGFGNVGPDLSLSAEDVTAMAGGSVSWSRLEERGRHPTSWNLSEVYQLDTGTEGTVISTDEEGDGILLPSDQMGGRGWYEIWPVYGFWLAHVW